MLFSREKSGYTAQCDFGGKAHDFADLNYNFQKNVKQQVFPG